MYVVNGLMVVRLVVSRYLNGSQQDGNNAWQFANTGTLASEMFQLNVLGMLLERLSAAPSDAVDLQGREALLHHKKTHLMVFWFVQ